MQTPSFKKMAETPDAATVAGVTAAASAVAGGFWWRMTTWLNDRLNRHEGTAAALAAAVDGKLAAAALAVRADNTAIWQRLDGHELLFRTVVTRDDLERLRRELREDSRGLAAAIAGELRHTIK